MASFRTEQILQIHHWNDKLFSFATTRNPALRFENGQFLMLGLNVGERNVLRAYSIASANYEDRLEFFSIKVPNGLLTSRLARLQVGDAVLIGNKPTGTLVVRDLKPGRRLFLLCTGTGVAPFLSIVKDPYTYDAFEQVLLIRGARTLTDLRYADQVLERLRINADLGPLVTTQLLDYPTVTREPARYEGRVTTQLASGRLFQDLKVPPLDVTQDRVMICGNMRMLADARALLDAKAFVVSPQIGVPGDYVIERAFVEAGDEREASPTHAGQAA